MNKPIVTIKHGKIQGAVVKSVLGPCFNAFYEIPFAAPPVGDLRFKDPQPVAPWTGVKDVSEPQCHVCAQLEEVPPKGMIGEEDCLYLNVYTTDLTKPKPVMFWIHGGALMGGTASPNMKKPDYLMTKDIVLVSSNYRLGAFGFLNLGHRVAPGNQGVKDVIVALEWVKENIANFGGDPNNVTIFGASAGAVICHALLLSPRGKGLFHKAIIQSGLLTAPWGLRESQPERCFRMAKLLGNDSTDPEEVVRFLRTVSTKDIVQTQSQILTPEEVGAYHLPFGITVDDVADDPILPLPLEQLVSNDMRIPIIVGHTSHECIMFIRDKSTVGLGFLSEYLPEYVKSLAWLKNLGPDETKVLLQDVKDWYLRGKNTITVDTLEGFIRFMTDTNFTIPARFFVEDRVKRMDEKAPTYFYQYSYVGKEKTHTDFLMQRLIKGASHVDDMSYLLYMPAFKTDNPDPPAEGTKDRLMIERLIGMWTNFAITGDPTPCVDDVITTTWKPATEDKLHCLDIGDELEMMVPTPHVLC